MRVSADVYPHVMSMGGGGLSSRVLASHEGGMAQELCTHVTSVGWSQQQCADMSRAWGVSAAMHPHPRAWGGGGVSAAVYPGQKRRGSQQPGTHPPHTPPPRVTNSGQLGSHRPRTHVSRARAASALSAPVPTCPERARPQQPRTRVSPAWSWGCWGGVVSQHPPSTHSMSTQGLSPPSLSLRGHGAPKPATVPGELAARPGEAERPRPRCPCPPLLLPPPGRPHGRQ